MAVDRARLERGHSLVLSLLARERRAAGHWEGELSTSALSTAVAVSALAMVDRHTQSLGSFSPLIQGGLRWLAEHQNTDGGWGDTTRSFSNISTTMLCRAAFHIAKAATTHSEPLRRADAWLNERYGTTPAEHAEAIRQRYGKDRTFSVPILMTSALAGLIEWHEVPRLPFELACFPQSLFHLLKMPVVSYALPALIAIGQTIHHHRPPWNPISRLVRHLAIPRSLKVLEHIQPMNGGFLEATPLTAFVTLSLASKGLSEHPVVRKGVEFIVGSVCPDGSWPIDTNLSTWVTTLAINAGVPLAPQEQHALTEWLIAQQYRERHPFTGAAPGGWGWTPLPGSVPDADDTAGAVLALMRLQGEHPGRIASAERGIDWLLGLQNRDGGFPTFCRGWGHLPFDRSSADITAHALRALHAVRTVRPHARFDAAIQRGLTYLERTQQADGSWLPLWFGNQHAPDDINPTYGTTKVLAAYRDLGLQQHSAAVRAVKWLLQTQREDGGWGGAQGTPASIEETALATEILLPHDEQAASRGLAWLLAHIEAGEIETPTPIGFYFAKLWYYERMYPLVFALSALRIS